MTTVRVTFVSCKLAGWWYPSLLSKEAPGAWASHGGRGGRGRHWAFSVAWSSLQRLCHICARLVSCHAFPCLPAHRPPTKDFSFSFPSRGEQVIAFPCWLDILAVTLLHGRWSWAVGEESICCRKAMGVHRSASGTHRRPHHKAGGGEQGLLKPSGIGHHDPLCLPRLVPRHTLHYQWILIWST